MMNDDEMDQWTEAAKRPEITVILEQGSAPDWLVAQTLKAFSDLNRALGGQGYVLKYQRMIQHEGRTVSELMLGAPIRDNMLQRARDWLSWRLFYRGWLPWQLDARAKKITVRVRE